MAYGLKASSCDPLICSPVFALLQMYPDWSVQDLSFQRRSAETARLTKCTQSSLPPALSGCPGFHLLKLAELNYVNTKRDTKIYMRQAQKIKLHIFIFKLRPHLQCSDFKIVNDQDWL